MSDAQYSHIDDARTLARICGYSREHALAELTAFSHREKAGLIPASKAVEVLARVASEPGDASTTNANRRQWRAILRTPENIDCSFAAKFPLMHVTRMAS